jgi:hypothetical protein
MAKRAEKEIQRKQNELQGQMEDGTRLKQVMGKGKD